MLAPPPAPAPPLPDLAEKVPLADADIFGAPRQFFTLGAAADAKISFVDEYAAFENRLGVYLTDADERMGEVRWVFERVEHAEPSDLASRAARPGGGPLSPGDSVLLSDLFDTADLGPGVEFGLFLLVDGWNRLDPAAFEADTLGFVTGQDVLDPQPATITDPVPRLSCIGADGKLAFTGSGAIMHSVDGGSPISLSNTLNIGARGQVTSGMLDERFVVAFEDMPLAQSDRDFNDATFAIDLLDGAVAGAEAGLESLLAPTEVV